MTSKSAKSKTCDPARRQVIFVVYPDIVLLDLSGPLQVFSHAIDPATGQQGFECQVVSVQGGAVPTNTVLSIPSCAVSDISGLSGHTVIVVGGDGAVPGMRDRALINTVSKLAQGAARVCSVCSGALVLAAAGLLDGRRAVTHWEDCARLANGFPKVEVEMDPIFIKDAAVWTSAGITAGIDMALAIVAEDLGRAASFRVARSMVVQMVRSGGQSQFSPVLGRQQRDGAGQFDALHTWIAENPGASLSVQRLAARTNMSARNFARVYAKEMGITPAKAVEAIRVEKAQALLAGTGQGIKKIATVCGFGSEERMRRAFVRLLNVSPTTYRQNFRGTSGQAGLE